MILHGRTWGDGGRALAELGYRVIAVDLRGHGVSGRGEYSPRAFADDLIETLPTGADLALGHSLGGLALSPAGGSPQPEACRLL